MSFPVLRLELFGGPALWRETSAIKVSPFQAALLSVAFAAGTERIPRARVQRLLWELEEDKSVRHRLSQLVYQVNQNCEARVLELESEYIRVSRQLVWCDLDEFGELIEANDYRKAHEMFERGFLSALTAKRTETLTDWLDEKRRGLRNRLRTSALEHWDAAEAAHDWTAARTTAEVLLLLNPDEELVLRRVMRAHAMTGQVREVEATYRAFAERAAPEGDWAPEPETLELLKDLKPATVAAATADPGGSEDPGAAAPFLGRKDSITPLSNSIYQSGRHWKTVAVAGETGIGKTRLVQEIVKIASLRGYRIVTASPAELEAGIPLSLMLEVMSQPWITPLLDGLPAPWKPMLLSLLPRSHATVEGTLAAHVTSLDNLPRQVCEAFLQLFTAIAETRKTILFLDDFHWADGATVRLLQFLARRWNTGDFTLLLAYRPEELGENDIVSQWVSFLQADSEATVATLDKLDRNPARQLARAVAADNVPDTTIERVVGLAGGNPRFLIDLAVDSPVDVQRTMYRDRIAVPLSVERSLIRRLCGLSDRAKRVLTALAVLGRAATFGKLARISDCSRDDCAGALEELQRLRLVAWTNHGVRIRQDITCTAIYKRLSPARRTLLHARTAELLNDQRGGVPLELIALHYFWAGNHDMAYLYATEAVEGTARADVSGRLRLLTVAYDVSAGLSRTLVAARLAEANYRSRRLRAALRFGQEALLKPDEFPPVDSAGIRLMVADAQHRLGLMQTPAALAEFSEVEDIARRERDELLLVAAVEVTVELVERVADHEAMAEQTSRIAKLGPFEDPAAQSRISVALSSLARHTDPELAIRHAGRALEAARKAELQDEIALALHSLATALIAGGQLAAAGAWEILDEAAEACQEAGRCGSLALLLLEKADWQIRTGDRESAEKTLAEAAALVEDMDCPQIRAMAGLARGNLALAVGDVDGGRRALRFARSVDSTPGEFEASVHPLPSMLIGALGGLEGSVLLESGKIGVAGKVAEQHPLEDPLGHQPEILVLFHARLKSRVGDLSEAIALLERAADAAKAAKPMKWLRLTLELVRLARRSGSPRPDLALEAQVRAEDLGLAGLAHEFGPFCED